MGMMDWKYESRRGVPSYLELNGMNVNEFGIDPDMTFNNSSENDEEHIQAQSEFDHKIDEILELLKKLFPELVDDGNHGIDSFCQVRDELLKIILWACKYNTDGMFSIAKTYGFWCYGKIYKALLINVFEKDLINTLCLRKEGILLYYFELVLQCLFNFWNFVCGAYFRVVLNFFY